MEYELDIRIDETALDVELLEQPLLMKKYGDIVSEARKDLDYAKEGLDAAKAELSKEIRSDPDAFGLGKITENLVADTIILQDAYKKAAEEVVEAQYQYGMARSAFDAIASRKDTLEGLNSNRTVAGLKRRWRLLILWKVHSNRTVEGLKHGL